MAEPQRADRVGDPGWFWSVLLPPEGPQQCLPGDVEQFVAEEAGRV
jgi:hypothetical protein